MVTAFNKIGFLAAGAGGNPSGIGNYVTLLDAAGIPAVVLCNDGTVGIGDALQKTSGVKHVMAFRVVRDGSEYYSVPEYHRTPLEAALIHWSKIRPYFPPEIVQHKDKVWILPINEVDHERASWLGYFGVELAKIAKAEGFKVSMFAFNSGEPEYFDWFTPGMVEYLTYCHNNREQAGICLHEYSFDVNDIEYGFPYLIGRFQFLHDACDELGLSYPYIIFGEWGWTLDNVPSPEVAIEHIDKIAAVYAQYPNILGAGIWYLGPYLGIAEKAQKLIDPVTTFTLVKRYEVDDMADCRGKPREQYKREFWLVNTGLSLEEKMRINELAIPGGKTVGYSADDAGIGDLDSRHVVLWGFPTDVHQSYKNFFAQYYPGVTYEFKEAPSVPGGGFRS